MDRKKLIFLANAILALAVSVWLAWGRHGL
jgi:hypothetical protein